MLGLSVSYSTLPVVLFPSTKAKKISLELIHPACFELSERNRKQRLMSYNQDTEIFKNE